MNDKPYLPHAYLETKRLPTFQQETRVEGGDGNKPRVNLLPKQGIIPLAPCVNVFTEAWVDQQRAERMLGKVQERGRS